MCNNYRDQDKACFCFRDDSLVRFVREIIKMKETNQTGYRFEGLIGEDDSKL